MTLKLFPPHEHTARLCLRAPVPEDPPGVCAIQGDPATNAFNPAGPPDDDECVAMLTSWISDWRSGVGYWCVRLIEDGPTIGHGGLRTQHLESEVVLNLYYRFAPEAWGHGYATELGEHCLLAAQAAPPAVAVQALIREDNTASLAVALRVGMLLTGVQSDGYGERQIFRA